MASLNETARALVAPGKGILAADESSGTIKKRFDSIGCESTEDRRRAYREMLFTTAGRGRPHQRRDPLRRDDPPAGLRRSPAGARARRRRESSRASRSTRARRRSRKSPNELVTDGLDGLRARLVEYRELGARFAKWRAVIDIGADIPSQYCIDVNAHALARYAALCQEEGIVPIVEPEVLMDGDHSIERCSTVTTATLHTVFDTLDRAAGRARRHVAQAQHGDPGQEVRGRPGDARRGRARRRSRASARSCPRRCPASCSCRAARATRRPPPTSTRSTSSARTRGRCRSPTAGRCRPPR